MIGLTRFSTPAVRPFSFSAQAPSVQTSAPTASDTVVFGHRLKGEPSQPKRGYDKVMTGLHVASAGIHLPISAFLFSEGFKSSGLIALGFGLISVVAAVVRLSGGKKQ